MMHSVAANLFAYISTFECQTYSNTILQYCIKLDNGHIYCGLQIISRQVMFNAIGNISRYGRHINRDICQETGDPARLRLPAQLSGRWRKKMNWNSVQWGKQIFCTGPIRASNAGQKSPLRGQRTNQGRRKDYLYSLSPQLPKFQQSAAATPL
jgi:hypothetical protein